MNSSRAAIHLAMQRRSGRRQPQDSKNSSSTENHADGELMGGDGTTKGKAYQPR